MAIHIYLHSDLDGLASASILADFVKYRNSNLVIEYSVVNYDEVDWQQRRLPENSFVLDFMYSPFCRVWFDHHESGKGQVPNFSKVTRFIRFKPDAPSCAGILFSFLKEKQTSWDWKRWEPLAKWADVIDSASYESAKQVVESKEPALKIRMALSLGGKDKDKILLDILHQLIEYRGDLDKVAELNRPYWEERQKKIQKAMDAYPKMIKIQQNVGILNLVNTYVPKDKYVPFYLNENLDYMITLSGWKGDYVVGIGKNPWKFVKNPINVGKLLEKLGGGGHFDVGAATSRDYSMLFNQAIEIFNLLIDRAEK